MYLCTPNACMHIAMNVYNIFFNKMLILFFRVNDDDDDSQKAKNWPRQLVFLFSKKEDCWLFVFFIALERDSRVYSCDCRKIHRGVCR